MDHYSLAHWVHINVTITMIATWIVRHKYFANVELARCSIMSSPLSRLLCSLPLVLVGETKIYKHPKADTLYLTIPSRVVQDSTFVFKKGDKVKIHYDPQKKTIIIEPIDEKRDSE